MKKKSIYLLLFVSLFSFQTIIAQSDTTVAIFYKPSEIPGQIEKATSFLVIEKNGISSTSMVAAAEKILKTFDEKFEKLNEASDSTSLYNYNSVQLKNINRQWEVLQNQLGQSLSSISERTKILGRKNEQFQTMLQTWQLTVERNNEKSIPANLSTSIDNLEKGIGNALEILQKEMNDLLRIQSGFSNKNIIIETRRIKLKSLITSKQRAALERNTYPLWEVFSDTSTSTSFRAQSSELMATYKSSLKEFYDFYESRIPAGVLIFLFFLALTLTLKYYSNKIEDNSVTIQKALVLLKRPFSISFLLFLFFLSLTTEATSTFEGFRKILMLIPLLIILLKIIDPKLKSGLYLFMLLFLVKELKVNTGSDTSIERVFLLGLTLLTYLAIYWVERKGVFKNILGDEKQEKYFKILFKISYSIVSLVLILNILGYVMLANILINGFYNSIYATILLLTASLVFNALILLFLKTKPLQKLKIVALHSENIISTLRKIITVFFTVIWIIIVLDAFQIYEMVTALIMAILSYNLGYGSISFAISDIILFVVTIWVAFQLSKFIQFVLEIDILPQLRLPRGVPGAITSLTNYFIIGLGILFAFISIGIDLNKFAFVIGALGVGIGFGLQNLVNNFISGIILIFERPIQIGDIIKVGDITGSVKKIGLRASVVRTFEGADIIVPNGNLISGELTNWTFSDQFRRMDITVGVEYGTDVQKIEELLLIVANANKGVLDKPAPMVIFSDFGNSSLDFVLRAWTKKFDQWVQIESEIRFAINKIFKENNITIPFPQTDLNFKNSLFVDKLDKNENSKIE